MKNSYDKLLFITGMVLLVITLTSFISAYSNLEINSTNYSGFFTTGTSPGNITASTVDGHSASFYQQAIGYLNDLLTTGIHGFSFNVTFPGGSPPTINLTRPKNQTYVVRTDIPLNYTELNALYVWYNIDLGGNTTLSGNTTFSTTNDLHTLYLWANNSYGTSSDNVTFTADTTIFTVRYGNYSGSTEGESTDFNQSTYEEIQNLADIILENTDYGKIKFNEAINLTNDSDFSDKILNLNSYTNISNNSIFLNSTALPNFNKSATLYLYNLSFDDPRVLKDGAVCSSTICTEINYSSGTFVFNVTEFSNYSAGETPVEIVPPPGGGPGGGGAAVTPSFSLGTNQISVSLNPGEVKTETLVITNPGTSSMSVKIENLFTDFVTIEKDKVVLSAGESETILLDIIVREDVIPNIYLGKMIFTGNGVTKEVLISIEVESEGALLDVRAEIEPSHKKILAGERILAQIRLFNLGGEGRKDIEIEYIVKDYEGNEIVRETESLAIETQITFLKEIYIPEGVKPESYVLYVRAIYEGKIASSSDNFEVVVSIVSQREKIYTVIIIILSIIIASIIYHMITRKKGGKKSGTGKISLRRLRR